jgi:hypothetical protein
MEIDDALNDSSPHGASVAPGSSLDNALEESHKTRVLYRLHRERFHKPADSVAVDMPCSLRSKAERPVTADRTGERASPQQRQFSTAHGMAMLA